jgi:hypothetical protein
MPTLPHNFPSIRANGNGGFRPSLLTIGAGMSFGIVPLPPKLCEQKRAKAEAQLSLTTSLASTDFNLYRWADEILQQLVAQNDPNPKLRLAQSLDIPTDHCWKGCAATERNTPRHRVIARFAREGIWEQIWSLNWDWVQESGFENVGIKFNEPDAGLPWPTGFSTFITAAECAVMGVPYVVKMIKPHGCVRALVEAEVETRKGNYPQAVARANRFLITETELANLAPQPGTQNFIFASLCIALASHPWVIAGWSVSETYLLNYIDQEVRPLLAQRQLVSDELSVIDIQFNAAGHTRLASVYRKTPADAHVPVGAALTTDQLFLWIQALYALDCLRRFANAEVTIIDQIAGQLQQPPSPMPFVSGWVDSFLPVWVRLCWRCGVVDAFNRLGQAVLPDNLLLESPGEHIPWHLPYMPRPELTAAARLLVALQNNGHGAVWDYEAFPGGLFRTSDNLLVIPLPAWEIGKINNLRGLKPLVDAICKHGAAPINRLAILPVAVQAGDTVSPAAKLQLKQFVAQYFPVIHFAQTSNIEDFELTDL